MPPNCPTDPSRYAAFIVRHLMRRVGPLRSSHGFAVAETEEAMDGDRWFWADDNAKVLEFLTLPALWRRHSEDVAEVFRFLRSLCRGSFILRRTGHPRLEARENDGARARFVHTFMTIGCDLPKGIVEVGMRFHDGRTARNLTLTGNYVQFTHDGERHTLDVEEAITGWDTRHRGEVLELSHSGELAFPQGGRSHRLGRLTYTYRFDARSMVIDAEAALDLDSAVTVSDVVLTIGQDDLSHGENAVTHGSLHVERPGQPPLHLTAGEEPSHRVHQVPGATYWCLAQQEEMRGFALGIHSLPREPGRVSAIRAVGEAPERLHWVVAEHLFPGRHQGTRLVAAERKLITSGGFYDRVDECAGLLRQCVGAPSVQPLDLSVSYDYGAELVAFARCVKGLSGTDPAIADPRMLEEARALYDRYLGVYADNLLARHGEDPGSIFSRPLSFVAHSLVDMLGATDGGGAPRYREALREVVDVLLGFERQQTDVVGAPSSVFLMGQGRSGSSPFMDCHSAARLALVRAAPVLGDDPRLPAAVARGLGAYCLATLPVEFGTMRKQDVVGIDFVEPGGARRTLDGYWNFSAALTLRAFGAMRRSRHPGIRQALARHGDRVGVFELLLRDQLRRSLRPRGDAIEIRTSVLSAEGNSETQPWAALALVEDPGDD